MSDQSNLTDRLSEPTRIEHNVSLPLILTFSFSTLVLVSFFVPFFKVPYIEVTSSDLSLFSLLTTVSPTEDYAVVLIWSSFFAAIAVVVALFLRNLNRVFLRIAGLVPFGVLLLAVFSSVFQFQSSELTNFGITIGDLGNFFAVGAFLYSAAAFGLAISAQFVRDHAMEKGGAAQFGSLLNKLELDTRLLGMIGAFIIITLVFNVLTEGRFLTPRNIFNLTIQTVSVAIMATGMVFVIVTRHIDLSVGAVLAVTSAMMAMTQTLVMPQWLGFELGSSMIAPVAIVIGILGGLAIGALHGWLIGYLTIPAFIVTLGGYLVWRNVGWYLTTGQTIGPLDETFQVFGGINGTLGETWSWVFGVIAVLFVAWSMYRSRQAKIAHEFPVKPIWAEFMLGVIAAVSILGFVAILNAYEVPRPRLARMFEARGEVMPEGYTAGYGLPISVFVLILIAVVMTVIAKRTRLGRYIFATGGNPEAAALAGINIRFLTVKVFMIMGVLAAISAVVASSRQTFHSNDIGTLDELRVIAAAVIGGTALSGGIGTIHGAILGALIMQSLQSGMAMVGVDAPFQNIVVGLVLVIAVLIDTIYRKRTGI